MRATRLLFMMIAMVPGALAAPAHSASLIEKQIYLAGPRFDGAVPECDWGAAQAVIQMKFAQKEAIFWASSQRVEQIEAVSQIALAPWGSQHTPRRYCTGTALMADGARRKISFWIAEDTGPFGLLPGVGYCVHGLDRNQAYSPDCKMARP